MSQQHLPRKRSSRLYRPMAIAALISAGVLQPLLPVLAAGTAADTSISNTATATYADDSGTIFNATSNTVQIKVAPVAGLTVKSTGITDSNGGAIEAGDSVVYNFDVTNIGNTPEDIYIPSAPTTTGLDPASVVVTYQIGAGAVTPRPANGIIPGVAPDQVVKVFVTANVLSTGLTAGNPVSVTLGNTAPNDNSPATQNVLDATDGANSDEVRTVALTTPTYTVNREASATQSLPFASKVTPQAFALIKKTATSVPGATPAGNDDVITYNLNFSVLNSSPNGSYTPAALVGTQVKVDNVAAPKILVSDAIPAGTSLQAAPTAPAGWTTVYSYDNVDTTIPIVSGDPSALPAASWSTAAPTPAQLSTVKRIGFIATATSIAAGSAAVDFPINVVTSGLPVNGGKVSNIAQVFGQTSGDTTNKVVLDESGDATPSNFEDTGVPGPNYNPATDTGKADPTTQGIDTAGNNSGTGTKGEDTQVTITGTVAAAVDSIFNGPNGVPNAVGPTDSNDDFTNSSTQPPAGQSPIANIATAQTTSFKNSVNNPGTTSLADVTVQPIAPSKAEAVDGIATVGQYGSDADIPVGTLVTVTELINGVATSKTATYIYSITAGVGSFALNTGSTTPVNLGTLAPNAIVSYKTDVTLPAGSILPLKAVPIPMVAFPDDNPTGANAGFTNETTNNITLDRVYTGYVKLIKEARILSADKSTIVQDWTDAAASGGLLTSKAAPGQYIEYRIRYQNISTPANGTGNVILNAKNFTLTEDGKAAVGSSTNNWGSFTLHQQNTTASQGSVNYYTGVNALIGTTDPADGNDVGKYENVVPSIAPAGQGVFQFRRVVK
jgi:hypothetical protein